jgi:uncharacterized protein (TIGR02270 family)
LTLAATQPRASSQAPLVFWDIVEESLDEAEFLWRQREDALFAHDQRLAEVEVWIEERLLGALDGLCVAGAAAVDRILVPALEADEPSRLAAAAYALAAGGARAGVDAFTAAFLSASGAKMAVLQRALELGSAAEPWAALEARIPKASGVARAAFLDASSFRGRSVAADFGALIASDRPVLQRAAARALRLAPVAVARQWIDHALAMQDPPARHAAVESGLMLGAPAAWTLCRDLAAADIAVGPSTLLLVAMLGSSRDHDAVVKALARKDRQEDAVRALAAGGRRSGADACVDLLGQGCLTKLAADSFCAITGLQLAAEQLVAPPAPEPDEPPAFEAEDLDAELAPKADDRLPEPDVPGVIRWWNQNRGRFDEQLRYVAGRSATFEALHDALVNAPMRRRHSVALELAVRTGGRYRVETSAFAFEQRGAMATFSSLGREAFATSFGADPSRPRRI